MWLLCFICTELQQCITYKANIQISVALLYTLHCFFSFLHKQYGKCKLRSFIVLSNLSEIYFMLQHQLLHSPKCDAIMGKYYCNSNLYTLLLFQIHLHWWIFILSMLMIKQSSPHALLILYLLVTLSEVHCFQIV